MTNQTKPTSLLGTQIGNRLHQLGMSRREFSRRFNISRQTLHELEHNPNKQFAPSTFALIDEGLKWSAGTAKAFHEGKENAREIVGERSTESQLETYLTQIMHQLASMNLSELEREVLMLEEEAYGRSTREFPLSMQVETRIQQLVRALIHAQKGAKVQQHGEHS